MYWGKGIWFHPQIKLCYRSNIYIIVCYLNKTLVNLRFDRLCWINVYQPRRRHNWQDWVSSRWTDFSAFKEQFHRWAMTESQLYGNQSIQSCNTVKRYYIEFKCGYTRLQNGTKRRKSINNQKTEVMSKI